MVLKKINIKKAPQFSVINKFRRFILFLLLFFREAELSFIIEQDDKRFFFDTGYSNVIIKNADKIRIDLRNINYVVKSHGS